MSISIEAGGRPTLAYMQSLVAKGMQDGTISNEGITPIELTDEEREMFNRMRNFDVFEAPKYNPAEREAMRLPISSEEFIISAELQKKLDNSYLNNVSKGDTYRYYGFLFNCENDEANRVFNLLKNGETNFQYSGGWYLTIDTAFARYEELRDEIYKVFGEDEEILNFNLRTLDSLLEDKFRIITRETAERLKHEQYLANLKVKLEYEPHKLAANKNFNGEKFKENSANLMKEFAQSFIAKIREGLSYADARKSAIEYMLSAFSKTTSVNNLSFSDYMIAERSTYTDKPRTFSREGNIAIKNEMNGSFNNSTELSAELRALLG